MRIFGWTLLLLALLLLSQAIWALVKNGVYSENQLP